ncbi:MAG: SDR family oxidoreductase [Anaerolineae bacterium]|nr:SDR family oxidoreductase [Anaerolineae bacterium]
MGNRVEGKVAVVTGAGSVGSGIGNGKAAALVYAREGARVMLVDYNLEAAHETRALIEQEGGESFAFQADVSQSGACQRMIEECIRTYGRIDILHNNVGIELAGGLDTTTEEAWDRTMAVNLKSMFLTCKYAAPYMERQEDGSIINISSINAIRTLPALSLPYAASKAAIIAMTREIAVEYAAKGIRANAILPGMMSTPFVVMSLTEAYGGDIEEMMSKRDALCPTGKQGESWDVAYLALFLASDESKYITGQAIVVDGAQTCRI